MPAPVAGRHVWGDACTSRVLCSGELPSESVFGWFPVSCFNSCIISNLPFRGRITNALVGRGRHRIGPNKRYDPIRAAPTTTGRAFCHLTPSNTSLNRRPDDSSGRVLVTSVEVKPHQNLLGRVHY